MANSEPWFDSEIIQELKNEINFYKRYIKYGLKAKKDKFCI